MVDYRNLRSVKELVAGPGWPETEGSIRWAIFNAKKNGLDAALVRVGVRTLIDIEKLNEWLEQGRVG